ncbi:tagatose-bisphosphate aldolase [Chelonobacter oris]|uniref:tagatose 1,6-diphosphate aldolase n=1 Tax=Chelonobacter oris TaxID=505317 RepID=UPI00244C130C|nr:tagatose 1,6-diphosphate aldolase [Chelonobacter oris]MDH3000368.1 tagatose-bisphosphate aldolase [Chelonobacter oris]
MKTNTANEKQIHLKKLCGENGVFSALAIDQRGALKRMMGENTSPEQIVSFKETVSEHLTPYASAILLDPEFGWPAAAVKNPNTGLLMAYEKTGYDKTTIGRFPDLIDDISVLRLKEKGADGVKLLIYIDIDEDNSINDCKKAFVERVASECKAEQLPLFLELLTYDANISDEREFAKIKPRKVIEAMKLFSDPRFGVDVLKVEVPVNMHFVEGFAISAPLYSEEEAKSYFKAQSDATSLPFIFLSAGVSTTLFLQTLHFAKQAGSRFNGVLCGRATWAGGADIFKAEGKQQSEKWMKSIGKDNIEELNQTVIQTATSIYE